MILYFAGDEYFFTTVTVKDAITQALATVKSAESHLKDKLVSLNVLVDVSKTQRLGSTLTLRSRLIS